MLERKDRDAVIIATPDHWHTPIVVDAVSAVNDVYIEKPMTYRIEEGPNVMEAANGNNQIVQVESQWISFPMHKKARVIVLSG